MLGNEPLLNRLCKEHHDRLLVEGDRRRRAHEALRSVPSGLGRRLGDTLITLGYRLKKESRPESRSLQLH